MKTLFFTLLFSLASHAYQDITCWDGDCFKNGWTRLDQTQGSFTDFQCYRSGCDSSGWIVGGSQNLRYYTQCKASGCFTEGWYEVDRETQMMKANIVCQDGDCLTNGWTTYAGNRALQTRCEDNDCRHKGWTSQLLGGNSVVYCKNESCFTEGWIESNLRR